MVGQVKKSRVFVVMECSQQQKKEKQRMSEGLLSKLSIKQRLRSANASLNDSQSSTYPQKKAKGGNSRSGDPSSYFISTVEKQLQHESHIYRKIKKRINELKLEKEKKPLIKNASQYMHKCFLTSYSSQKASRLQLRTNSFKVKRQGQEKKEEREERKSSGGKPFEETTSSLNYTKSATNFIRSPQSTKGPDYFNMELTAAQTDFSDCFKPMGKALGKKTSKGRKDNLFEIEGSRPQWGSFESYRICSHSQSLLKKGE